MDNELDCIWEERVLAFVYVCVCVCAHARNAYSPPPLVVGMGCLCAHVTRWGNFVCFKFQFAFVCDLVKIFQ